MENLDYESEYLYGQLERVEIIEANALKIEKGEDVKASLGTIFKEVHSMKGSAGSFGYPLINTICHNFEDLIEHLDEKNINDKSMSTVFKYVDMLKETVKKACNKEELVKDDYLKQIKSLTSVDEHSKRVLIVDSSKIVGTMIASELKNRNISASKCSTAIDALGRLLHEPFDCVISSLSLSDMSGASLMNAISNIEELNSDITKMIISSNVKDDAKLENVDYIFKKDASTAEAIGKVLNNKVQKIYYVDDDPDIHILIKMSFKGTDEFEVEYFKNPLEAIERAKVEQPDIFIVDVIMPELRGEEVLEKLNAENLKENSKFIFLTGKNNDDEVKRLAGLGADGVLTKPFNPGTLVADLKKFL